MGGARVCFCCGFDTNTFPFGSEAEKLPEAVDSDNCDDPERSRVFLAVEEEKEGILAMEDFTAIESADLEKNGKLMDSEGSEEDEEGNREDDNDCGGGGDEEAGREGEDLKLSRVC